ncbi:MAG: F0F1 ATP synthase subunit delta [Verrucomicrobiota bacterium]
MKVSKDARKGAKALYNASFTAGRLDEVKVGRILSEVATRHPAGYAQILHEYHRLVRLEVERRTAIVESSAALCVTDEKRIEAAVKAQLGDDVRAEFVFDSDLIAGLRIRIGSDVYERSIRERLNRLRWELAH